MKNQILGKPQNTLGQFIRYLFVGGFAAIIDTGCLYVLNARFSVSHLAAAAAGFALGLLINYIFSIIWVFESTGDFKGEFAVFSLIGISGLGWTELIMWVSVDHAHAPVLAAKILALGIVLIWNFAMRKKFVFEDRRSAS